MRHQQKEWGGAEVLLVDLDTKVVWLGTVSRPDLETLYLMLVDPVPATCCQ